MWLWWIAPRRGFHPLKAGRRHFGGKAHPPHETVSIPSRRVGDVRREAEGCCRVSFPSPQGGSETKDAWGLMTWSTKFPSPQGGSETYPRQGWRDRNTSFHPLKAGRRLAFTHSPSVFGEVSIPSRRVGDSLIPACPICCLMVSIPSRRVGDVMAQAYKNKVLVRFHPLKAGRRPSVASDGDDRATKFPSPQGGSETESKQSMGTDLVAFPSPQGGSETLLRPKQVLSLVKV